MVAIETNVKTMLTLNSVILYVQNDENRVIIKTILEMSAWVALLNNVIL